MVFDFENASREQLIEYLTTEHRRPLETISDHSDEELRILASIGNEVVGDAQWYHYAPFVLAVVAVIQLVSGNFVAALIIFILAVVIMFIAFLIGKDRQMKTYYKLREENSSN